MSRIKLGVAVLSFCLLASAARAEEENPFKKAKVGDWTEYKISNKAAGMAMEGEQKTTVTKVTAEEVTMDVIMKMMGQEMKQSTTVKLNEKYDPTKMQYKDATVKEIGKGDEKVTAGGKTFDAKWVELEVSVKMGAQEMKVKSKVWSSATVPLGGMVKMETDSGAMGKMTMELKDFGMGK